MSSILEPKQRRAPQRRQNDVKAETVIHQGGTDLHAPHVAIATGNRAAYASRPKVCRHRNGPNQCLMEVAVTALDESSPNDLSRLRETERKQERERERESYAFGRQATSSRTATTNELRLFFFEGKLCSGHTPTT